MKFTLALILAILFFLPVKAQDYQTIDLLKSSKQSYISIRPEVTLFSKTPIPFYHKGKFTIDHKPGVSIGYGKRYKMYKDFGIELGVFAGITRFAYSAVAPKEQFPARDYTFENHQSLVNPYLAAPILLNYQKPLTNKYLITVFAGPNFQINPRKDISAGLSFSNAQDPFTTGDVYNVRLVFLNKPITAGIITGTGIGKMLPNHNVLQLNFWANVGLTQRIRGYYYFYEQEYDQTGENIVNTAVGGGTIQSHGSMVGTEIRYTFTGIRKRLKALGQ